MLLYQVKGQMKLYPQCLFPEEEKQETVEVDELVRTNAGLEGAKKGARLRIINRSKFGDGEWLDEPEVIVIDEAEAPETPPDQLLARLGAKRLPGF